MTARDRIVIAVLAVVGLIAGFWFLVLGPKRSEAAKLETQVAQITQVRDQALSDAASSRAARRQFASNYMTVARLGKAVPGDDDVPALVYQLDSTAKASGVNFQAVKVGGDSGTPAPPTNAAAASAATQDGSTGTTGPSGSGSAPVAATQAATAALPPGVAVGSAGFPTMPFSFTFDGSFFNLASFLGRLDQFVTTHHNGVAVSGRLLTLDAISLQFGPGGFPHMTAQVSAEAYVVPPDQGATAGVVPSLPGSGSTQAVSGGASSAPPVPAATMVAH